MKRSIALLSTLILMGLGAEGWAGSVEEVAQLAGPRIKALQDGDVEAYAAAYADNAVLNSSFSPFRIEGKDAIKAYFADLVQLYPKRRVFPRQPSMRAYNDDLVVSNGYAVLQFTDQKGQVMTYYTRSSVAWAKLGGRWQIVEQHTSRIPVAP
jgi:uncharacterized protein (TIGR02246 family)